MVDSWLDSTQQTSPRIVWHRHSCLCPSILLREAGKGKSACATQSWLLPSSFLSLPFSLVALAPFLPLGASSKNPSRLNFPTGTCLRRPVERSNPTSACCPTT